MNTDDEKAAFNAHSEAAMQSYLKSKSWPEKIRSIERMNRAARIAREAMRKVRAGTASGSR